MEFTLTSMSIAELAGLIQKKELKVIDIVRATLQQIYDRNDSLNGFITINPDAEAVARRMDEKLATGKKVGPLFGIPIAVKDMIDTQSMKTTMGSKIYEDHIPIVDAHVVTLMQDAGAIIIGKTNTHQFAYGPTGDRSYYGPMRNPYNTAKMAGGSSGGSAVAVAAGLATGALGTDTSGSIRIPSAFCGLVGMKPTNGSVSTYGVNALAQTLDCVGPMTKNVQDNEWMYNILRGDNKIANDVVRDKVEPRFSIGIPNSFFFDDIDYEIAENFQKVKEGLEQKGIEIREVQLPDFNQILDAQRTVIAYESYQIHKENLTVYPDRWDAEVKERLEKTSATEKDFHTAKEVQRQSRHDFNKSMKNVDALLTPTSPILTPDIDQRVIDHVNSDGVHTKVDVRSNITRLTAPTNLLGVPSLTIPSGVSSAGLPMGVQLIGTAYSEETLYKVAYALESMIGNVLV